MRILLVLAVLGAPFAKSATVFEDRPALVVSNDKLELTVMAEGGALANLILRDEDRTAGKQITLKASLPL